MKLLDDELCRLGGHIGSACLMSNHIHLLIKMGAMPLSKILQNVHMKYALYFNRKRKVVGYTFQGRPGIKIVMDNRYLKTLVAYIHQNPVKAKIVKTVKGYKWSTWKKFYGRGLDWVYLKSWHYPPEFEEKDRKRIFRELTSEEVEYILGGDVYIGCVKEWNKLEKRNPMSSRRKPKERRNRVKMDTVVDEICQKSKISQNRLRSSSKNRLVCKMRRNAMALLYGMGYGNTEIGEYFNRSASAVSHAIKKYDGEI